MRNIFNVATEHVKQIKATRAAIADVSPTERRRQQLELPLTMGIMITSWLCWLPFRGHGAWARQTYYMVHICDKSGKLAGAGRKLARRLRIRHMDQAQRQLRATFNLKCFSGGREGGWLEETTTANTKLKPKTKTNERNQSQKPKPKSNNKTSRQSLTNIQRTRTHTTALSPSLSLTPPSLSLSQSQTLS